MELAKLTHTMKNIRKNFLMTFILFCLLLSGCQVFPYVQAPNALPTFSEAVPTQTRMAVKPSATVNENIATRPVTATLEPTDDFSNTYPDPDPTFTLQENNPITLPNFTHPEAGCAWLGVAGQVFDSERHEIQGLTIIIGSLLDEENFPVSAVTGETTAYGPGGYEIQISDAVYDSTAVHWIQVLDQDGNALTDQIFFNTFDECQKNLILINFVPLETEKLPKSGIIPEQTQTLEAYP